MTRASAPVNPIQRRRWLEQCARAILQARSWLGTITAIKIAADLWEETGGAMAPERAASAELATWASTYLVLVEGHHLEFRDSASSAVTCAVQLLAMAHDSQTAQVRDSAGRHLVSLRREEDGSITELPL